MKDRMKAVRYSLTHHDGRRYTQADFAKELGLAKATITAYETGNRVPADSVISLICIRYGISKDWLLTGEGDMKASSSKESELSHVADQILHETNPLRIELHKLIGSMGDEELKAARLLFDFLMKNTKKK